MSDYSLTQAEFVRLKTRLSTKLNKFRKLQEKERASPGRLPDAALQNALAKSAKDIQAECDYAMGIFQEKGYPDDWHRWERAKDDVQYTIQKYDRAPGVYGW